MSRSKKRGRQLIGTKHRLTPDLVFPGIAVGDIKYALMSSDWRRGDLYQLTTFATGYGVGVGGLFSFASHKGSLPDINIGPVSLRAMLWDCSDDTRDPTRQEPRSCNKQEIG